MERKGICGDGDTSVIFEKMWSVVLNRLLSSALPQIERGQVCVFLVLVPFIWHWDSRGPVGLAFGLVFS